MKRNQRPNRKFLSDSCLEQGSAPPDELSLVLGWTVSGAMFVSSLWILPYSFCAGLLLFGATTLFIFYLTRRTDRMTMRNSIRYEFVLTDTDAVLLTHDMSDNQHFIESVSLHDVSVAEIFRTVECANLTLLSPGRNLQIPLSLFGEQAQSILFELRRRGVMIVSLHEERPRLAA